MTLDPDHGFELGPIEGIESALFRFSFIPNRRICGLGVMLQLTAGITRNSTRARAPTVRKDVVHTSSAKIQASCTRKNHHSAPSPGRSLPLWSFGTRQSLRSAARRGLYNTGKRQRAGQLVRPGTVPNTARPRSIIFAVTAPPSSKLTMMLLGLMSR